MDAVFRPGIDALFYLSNITNFEIGSMVDKQVLINEEQTKENYSPPAKTPDSEKPNISPCDSEKFPFWNKN